MIEISWWIEIVRGRTPPRGFSMVASNAMSPVAYDLDYPAKINSVPGEVFCEIDLTRCRWKVGAMWR